MKWNEIDDDLNWKLFVLLLQIVDIVFSPCLTSGHVSYLRELIVDHHTLFRHLYPNAIAAKPALLFPVSNLNVPNSDYHSLTRTQAGTKTVATPLELWNSEQLHAIEPRVNVINLFRLPHRDEIIIQRLRIGHTYLII